MSYGIQVTPRRHLSEDEGGPSRTVDTPCPTGSKRKRDALEDSGDDSFGALDSDDEREMVALADTAGSRSKTNPKTPTTSRNIDTVTGLPTPSTTRTLFPDAASRSNKRHKTVSVEETPDTPSRAPTTTLSTTAPPSSPIPSSPSTNDAVHNPTDEVMALLRPHNLGASVLQSVRSVLATSVRRTRGLALGRDSARTAAREKDARIARLQERVAALENKDRMMNSQITNMKAGIMKLYQDN